MLREAQTSDQLPRSLQAGEGKLDIPLLQSHFGCRAGFGYVAGVGHLPTELAGF